MVDIGSMCGCATVVGSHPMSYKDRSVQLFLSLPKKSRCVLIGCLFPYDIGSALDWMACTPTLHLFGIGFHTSTGPIEVAKYAPDGRLYKHQGRQKNQITKYMSLVVEFKVVRGINSLTPHLSPRGVPTHSV